MVAVSLPLRSEQDGQKPRWHWNFSQAGKQLALAKSNKHHQRLLKKVDLANEDVGRLCTRSEFPQETSIVLISVVSLRREDKRQREEKWKENMRRGQNK